MKFFQKMSQPKGRILVARTDRLGDFIQSIPTFHALAKLFPGKFCVLCSCPQDQLLKQDPLIPELIVADPSAPEKSLDQIRGGNFEVLVNLVDDATMRKLMPSLKFIPKRIGNFNRLAAFFWYNFLVVQKRSRSVFNEAEYNALLLNRLGVFISEVPKPRIFLSPEEISKMQEKLARLKVPIGEDLIAVHCGMNRSALNWGDQNYVELVQKLANAKMNIVLTGGNLAEWTKNEKILRRLPEHTERIFNLANLFGLRDFAAFLSLAKKMVAPSTGVLHLASAVGCKVYGIYPPILTQSPHRWQPYRHEGKMFTPEVRCPANHKCLKEKCSFFDCMSLITPQEIAEEILSR